MVRIEIPKEKVKVANRKMIAQCHICWQRICLKAIDLEGNVWNLVAIQGRYLGKHYGHRGHDATVQLTKNGEIVESCHNYTWSSVKHLTPKVLKLFNTKIP